MTNETSAERIQRRWDEGAPEREARRERLAQENPVRRLLSRAWSLVLLVLIASVVLGIVALAIWFLIVSAGIILKLVGAVLLVVVVSLAWQQIRSG